MAGTIDDRIKNINAKMARVRQTFGADSTYYDEMMNLVTSYFTKSQRVKQGKSDFRVSRSKDANITTDQLDKMEAALNKHTLQDMKREATQYLRESGHKGRVKTGDFRKAADDIAEIKNEYTEAINALYKWEHASDEAAFIIAEAKKKGKKSYAVLMNILRRARQADNAARANNLKPDATAVPSVVRKIIGD